MVEPGPSKDCTGCAAAKPVEAFPWRQKARGLRNTRCRECLRVETRRHYERNRESYKQRSKTQIESIVSLVRDHKTGKPCADCGIIYPYYVMDFDHRDPKQKFRQLSKMARRFGRLQVLAEIAKCDIVCANCHRERTHGHRK